MRIQLLGRPVVILDDGSPSAVRGYQTWALLARVLLSDRPLSRRQLSSELFPDTADPMGALRWCLAALRRVLGRETLAGDPVIANLPRECRVDVLSLDSPDYDLLEAGELLAESEPTACGSDFLTWLLVERTRIAARVDERIRRDTLSALASLDAERAVLLARAAVQRDAFNEGHHILLVRALVLSGNVIAARQHVERVEEEFRRELGEPPTPALRSAARANVGDPPLGSQPISVVEALVEAGKAALAAGASDAGIDCLRRAVAASEAMQSPSTTARCLVDLGTALIHSVRGYDDEGVLYLRQAEEAAAVAQERHIECKAVLEQSYANALAGRRPDAQRLTDRALELADGHDESLAAAHCFSAFNLADWGRFEEAADNYERSIQLARMHGLPRRQAWALGLGSWGHMRAGRLEEARTWARDSITLCEDLRWLSFRPWPETVLCEVDLRDDGISLESLRSRLENTLAMSCQLSDPCWEAAACRVIGLTHEKTGQAKEALQWLERAQRAITRVTDPYAALWTRIMLDQSRIALVDDRRTAEGLARHAIELSARTHADNDLSEALGILGRAR